MSFQIPNEEGFEVGRKRTYPPIPIPIETRSLFEFCNPSKFIALSDEELAKHISENRKKIEQVSPWPCLYWYAYLPHSRVSIRNSSYPGIYQDVVKQLCSSKKARVLDMGGMIGHDVRCLIQDGVSPDQVVCADLFPSLFELGNELYCDSMDDDHLKGSQFEHVDIFNQEQVDKIRFPQKYYAIYTAKFVHLFSRENQKQVMKILIGLLSNQSGSIIFGSDSGRKEGEEGKFDMRSNMKLGSISEKDSIKEPAKELFHHSCSSFYRLIEEVQEELQIPKNTFTLQIELRSFDPPKGDGELACDPNHLVSLTNSIAWALKRR